MAKTTVNTNNKPTAKKADKKIEDGYTATLIKGRTYRVHGIKQTFEYGVATPVDKKTADYLRQTAITIEVAGKDPEGNPIEKTVDRFIIKEVKAQKPTRNRADLDKDDETTKE